MLYIGNPILDITVDDSKDELLKKYNLQQQKNRAFLLDDQQSAIITEVWNMKNNKLTLGGAALNSARASVHWLKRSGTRAKILYTGSIGEDSIGNKVFTETEKAGVEGFFGRTSKARTATVVSFLDANTCMPAKVGFIQAYILFSSCTSSFYYNF